LDFRNGFDVPFSRRSRLVDFIFGIRVRFPTFKAHQTSNGISTREKIYLACQKGVLRDFLVE
jgi:hypothetical protein